MAKSVKQNIVRYIVSLVLPLCLVYYPIIALAVTLLLLYLNNVLDDYSFYFAGKEAVGNKMTPASSPVNGIITQVEHGVPLFSHIKKVDVLTKEELIAHLKEQGIDTRLLFVSMSRQKSLMDYGCDCSGEYPVTDWLTQNGFYLPSASSLTEEQIKRICSVIIDYSNK